MADVYKQSFKQNYTNNIELSIFNCGIERCAPSKTWGPGIRDHYLIHLVLSGKGEFEVGGRTWQVSTGDLFFLSYLLFQTSIRQAAHLSRARR